MVLLWIDKWNVGGGGCSESNKWLIIMINGEYCIELNNWFKGTIVHETRFKLYRWESTNKGLNGTVVNRQVKRGGGVLLCIREGLNVQLRVDKWRIKWYCWESTNKGLNGTIVNQRSKTWGGGYSCESNKGTYDLELYSEGISCLNSSLKRVNYFWK